eukprot:TRINITY_DN28238_c0_g1_i1.p1 TRINITY_DN28238_c0_g1~~TRINITY_DN28238_c0_g1_i1.p1  ORF type:complete len:210 (-),score=22.65 TRINITY_DN28238_c0_g1_i1:260-889(-)
MPIKASQLSFGLPCGRRAFALVSVSIFWTKACLFLVSLATVLSGELYSEPRCLVPMLVPHSGLRHSFPRSTSVGCAVSGNSDDREAGAGGGSGMGGKPKQSDVPWWRLEEEMNNLVGSRMPFQITRVSPPPATHLGYELLHPGTSRGDTVRVKGCDDSFMVSKVRFLYDFVGGRHRIRSKVLEVQTPKRYKINKQLESLVPGRTQGQTP